MNYSNYSLTLYYVLDALDGICDEINQLSDIAGAKESKPSTLWNPKWPRRLVQQKIVEAYRYCKKKEIIPKYDSETKNWTMTGQTNEGIEVFFVITKDAVVRSAYAIL